MKLTRMEQNQLDEHWKHNPPSRPQESEHGGRNLLAWYASCVVGGLLLVEIVWLTGH